MSTLLRRCFECGQPLGRKDVFCPRCGAKQPRDKYRQTREGMNLDRRRARDERGVKTGFRLSPGARRFFANTVYRLSPGVSRDYFLPRSSFALFFTAFTMLM